MAVFLLGRSKRRFSIEWSHLSAARIDPIVALRNE
jgi:hypothetical protein